MRRLGVSTHASPPNRTVATRPSIPSLDWPSFFLERPHYRELARNHCRPFSGVGSLSSILWVDSPSFILGLASPPLSILGVDSPPFILGLDTPSQILGRTHHRTSSGGLTIERPRADSPSNVLGRTHHCRLSGELHLGKTPDRCFAFCYDVRSPILHTARCGAEIDIRELAQPCQGFVRELTIESTCPAAPG